MKESLRDSTKECERGRNRQIERGSRERQRKLHFKSVREMKEIKSVCVR